MPEPKLVAAVKDDGEFALSGKLQDRMSQLTACRDGLFGGSINIIS